MRIDDALLRRLEAAAHLALTPEEREAAKRRLEDLLPRLDKLAELDDIPVEPLPLGAGQPLREDVVQPSLPREEALANAPRQAEGCFVAPKTVERGTGE